MAEGTCSEAGCGAPVVARGYCRRCYKRHWWRSTYVPRPKAIKPDKVCIIPGCGKLARSKSADWCPMHYYRNRRHGDPLHTEHRPGERTYLATNGYLFVTLPAGHPLKRVGKPDRQHRLVLFDAIGYGPHLCHWCGCCMRDRTQRGSSVRCWS